MGFPGIYVLYHANCYDGLTAAWAAHKKHGDRCQYIPVTYGSAPPEIEDNAMVFIVDFSYPRETLLALQKRCDVIVLDHHKTAEVDLAGLDWCHFDMSKSGAMLAWEYFQRDVPPPMLVQYVQDRDLWRFELPFSREVAAWLRSYPMKDADGFFQWDLAASNLEHCLEDVIKEGAGILRFQSVMVDTMAKHATLRILGDFIVPVVNATVFFSEVGERMCELDPMAPFSAYYLDRDDERRQWGLRSRGSFDCSAIAKKFGGGGHAGAAGFVTEIGWLPEQAKA